MHRNLQCTNHQDLRSSHMHALPAASHAYRSPSSGMFQNHPSRKINVQSKYRARWARAINLIGHHVEGHERWIQASEEEHRRMSSNVFKHHVDACKDDVDQRKSGNAFKHQIDSCKEELDRRMSSWLVSQQRQPRPGIRL